MLVEVVPGNTSLPFELEQARRIRNSVRMFMTNNTEYITKEDQIEWYNGLDHDKLRLFLYYIDGTAVCAGYGIINTSETEFPLLTGAILEHHQGYGHGRTLFSKLIDISLKDYYHRPELDVLESNEKAIKLYKSLGFTEIERLDETIFMAYTGPRER